MTAVKKESLSAMDALNWFIEILVGVGDIEIFCITIYLEKILRYYYISRYFLYFHNAKLRVIMLNKKIQNVDDLYLKLKFKL